MVQVQKKNTGLAKQKRKKLLFYIALVGLPSLQFLVFYVIVNFNSLLLAFRSYDVATASYSFAGWENFKQVFHNFAHEGYWGKVLVNSLLVSAFTLLVGTTLAIVFSYYIYKKGFFSGGFKVLLFVPQIVSSLVFVLIFKFFVSDALPEILQKLFHVQSDGLLSKPSTRFGTILFYTIWVGFGTQVLMYTGAMGGISDSVMEAGKLDGIKPMRELVTVVVPMIFNTVATFIVVGVAAVFVNQMNLYSFYGTNPPTPELMTFGYYLYKESQLALNQADYAQLPYLAAMGLFFTAIAAPLTVLLRKGLDKLGERF